MTIYEICLAHSRMDRELRTNIANQLDKHELTMMQWLLLGTLSGEKKGLSMSEIARLLDITLPQVTALLVGLAQRKVVKLKTQKRDRRSRHAVLTTKGETVLGSANNELESAADKLFPNNTKNRYSELLAEMHVPLQEFGSSKE